MSWCKLHIVPPRHEHTVRPSLGIVIHPKGEAVTVREVRELSLQEYQQYQSTAKSLFRYVFDGQALTTVHEAYAEYADTVQGYQTKYINHENFDMLRMN
jgi:hypothetical protein